MALVVHDRVKETSTTTGTGTFTLAGAVTGFETFSSAIGNTNTTYYAIVHSANAEFEVGLGTVGAGTLARTTVITSSNSDSAVNFSAGTKNVFCTLPASKSVILDASGNIVANNASNLTALNATQLTSGTVPDARFPATLPALNGSALTALNASNLASGTVANARLDADLAAIGNLTSAADKGIQFTGSGTAATYDLTAAGKALLDDANAAAQRTTLGLVIGTDVQAYDAQLADIAGLTPTDSNFIVGNGTNFVAESGATARTSLGLGSIATLNTVTLTTNTTGDYVASITAGEGITGAASGEGSTPTLAVDLNELTTSVSDADGDFFAVVDSLGAQKKLTKANINNSGFNNDAGFTTNTGTVTSVSGGNGLTGSVTTSGSLAVGAGTGIDVTADAVAVDVSDFMTNGANNRVLTATGTDAMNAEANMTFDGSTLTVTGDIVPGTNNTFDLGALGNVWQNIYTGDLHLSNEAKDEGNAVDGTKGNWTIQEGAEHLYILNNKSGKKYRFKLEEM